MKDTCVDRVGSASIELDGAIAGPPTGRRPRLREPFATAQKSRIMTNVRGILGSATAALLLVAVASCANGSKDPGASRTPTPSSAATTTATTPPSKTEVAATAASALVRKYYATVDKLSQHPTAPLNELSTVTTSVQLSAEQILLKTQRRKGERQTGNTNVATLKVQAVNLEDSDPNAGKVPTVQVDVCWNVSDVDVVDANGKSIVSPTRPDTGWTRLTVANYNYGADPSGGWRVATGQDLKQKPCASS